MKHKLETIKKLLQIAKGMESEDAQAFKKKKLAPAQPVTAPSEGE